MDPEMKDPSRNVNGTWIAPTTPGLQYPMGVDNSQGVGGMSFVGMRVKNAAQIANCDTSLAALANTGPTSMQFKDCYYEGLAYSIGYNSSNRGIGNMDREAGFKFIAMDSTPGDGAFMSFTGGAGLLECADAMPSAGRWVEGRFMKNLKQTPVNGFVVSGWLRAPGRTGATNIANVDWLIIQAPAYQSPNTYNASSSSGHTTTVSNPVSANDNVSILYNNSSTPGDNLGSGTVVYNLAPGMPINDGLARTIVVPPNTSGGVVQISVLLNSTTSQIITITKSMTIMWIQALGYNILVSNAS